MTAEKQYVDDYVNVYQGKKWSLFTIIGLMAAICVTMAIRDIGMVFVYGSIYDKIALDGVAKASVSFMSYVVMVLLYIIPLILPVILRLTQGAYFDEPETSPIPSFNSKVLNILVYVALVVVGIVPLVLFVTGVFTSTYMFVALNVALMLFSNVTIFYYFGTYILQRAKMGLAMKYVTTNVMMVVTSLVAFIITAAGVALLYFAGTFVPFVKVTLVDHMLRFLANWNMIDFTIKALCMFVTIGLATLVSGLVYNYTQNILYSATPTLVLSFANIVLFQRAREAYTFITTSEQKIADLKARLEKASANRKQNYLKEIAELEEGVPSEMVSMILCYVAVAAIIIAIAAIGAYAVLRLIMNLAEDRKAKQ